MSDDRRTARRVRLPGVQVTYEGATGERQQARVVDLSREGLYIPSAKPLAVGKRLSLEIQPIGDTTAWSALGRVVWIREFDDGGERPAGMAVKIIDAEDAVLTGIEHLLEAREPTDRGLGYGDTILPVRPRARSNPPSREKTMMGVGLDETSAPEAPILITAPGREPTLVGVGSADALAAAHAANAAKAGDAANAARAEDAANAREASLAIDLVTKKPPSVRPGTAPDVAPVEKAPESIAPVRPSAPLAWDPEPSARESESVAPPPRRGSGWGWFLLLLLAIGGGAGFVFRDRVLVFWHAAVTTVTRQLR